MKYIFFVLAIIALPAISSAQADKSKATEATKELNKKPLIVAPLVSMDDASAPPQNHLKVLTFLQRLESILKRSVRVL